MDLAGALFDPAVAFHDRQSDSRRLVAFVGAGGKKTAIRRLIEEGRDRDLSVAYTTTTHTPPLSGFETCLVPAEEFPDALATASTPTLFASRELADPARADRKVRGYEPAVVDAAFAASGVDWLLVKADGARRREFKAPGPDEPVVPRRATHVVAVASVAAVGDPLTDRTVHRPDRVAAVTGLAVGDRITPAAVGRVLASEAGGLKAVPDGATPVPLVNKADTPTGQSAARTAIETALELSPRFERGLVTSFERGSIEVIETP
jgi:probable selenium-dependent hydroxylase accessory protein YqeC